MPAVRADGVLRGPPRRSIPELLITMLVERWQKPQRVAVLEFKKVYANVLLSRKAHAHSQIAHSGLSVFC